MSDKQNRDNWLEDTRTSHVVQEIHTLSRDILAEFGKLGDIYFSGNKTKSSDLPTPKGGSVWSVFGKAANEDKTSIEEFQGKNCEELVRNSANKVKLKVFNCELVEFTNILVTFASRPDKAVIKVFNTLLYTNESIVYTAEGPCTYVIDSTKSSIDVPTLEEFYRYLSEVGYNVKVVDSLGRTLKEWSDD